MVFSESWNGYCAVKAQSGLGAQASGGDGLIVWTSGGQGGLLSKTPIESRIIRHDAQQLRGRHGSRRTAGTYTSELGMGRVDPILAAIMRNAWSTANLQATQSDFTSITTGANTIVCASGSPITKGFRVGDIIRLTNHASAGNNGRNLRITALSATTITVAETLTVNGDADTSFEITRPGRVLINSGAGALVKPYFTIEEYEYDLDASEIFDDAVFSRLMIRMQPDGNLDTEYGWTGTGKMEVKTAGDAPHFSAPTDPTALSLVATEAVVMLNGTEVADLTAFDFTVDLSPQAPPVINASGLAPDVALGTFRPTMNMTVLRSDLQALADFNAETQLSVHLVASENEAAPADFFSLFVGNFTLGGVAKSAMQKEGGFRTATLSIPQELVGKDTRGGAFDATTTKIQVSNAS